MAQDYDKIFKENLEEIIHNIARSVLKIKHGTLIEIPDDLQYTIEKKPDFLKRVEKSVYDIEHILHIEIQSTDPPTMIYRMLVYYAFLWHVYKFEVRQYVLYIGNKGKPNMPSSLVHKDISYSFKLINIMDVNHELFLYSDKPEEIIIAILCDFKEKSPEFIIEAIIERIKHLAKDTLKAGKYLTQLEVLSKLRNLQEVTIKKINKMPIDYDMATDLRFLQGKEEGKADTIKSVKAKMPHLSNCEISDLLNVSKEFVNKVIGERKGNR